MKQIHSRFYFSLTEILTINKEQMKDDLEFFEMNLSIIISTCLNVSGFKRSYLGFIPYLIFILMITLNTNLFSGEVTFYVVLHASN